LEIREVGDFELVRALDELFQLNCFHFGSILKV
jgi:hypothetical protein